MDGEEPIKATQKVLESLGLEGGRIGIRLNKVEGSSERSVYATIASAMPVRC